jgi:acyl carrier protein
VSTSDLRQTHFSTLDRIEAIVRDLLDNDVLSLAPGTKPSDVEGWDSLANVSIIFSIEEEFGVRLGEDVMGGFDTVGDLVALIDSAGTEQAA